MSKVKSDQPGPVVHRVEAVIPTSVRLPPILYELVQTKRTPGESLGQALRRLVGEACGYESSQPPSSTPKPVKSKAKRSGKSKGKTPD